LKIGTRELGSPAQLGTGLAAYWLKPKLAEDEHSLVELMRQRVHGLACGYPDANDAARLQRDPIKAIGMKHQRYTATNRFSAKGHSTSTHCATHLKPVRLAISPGSFLPYL
jgi:hypothetical protein